MDATKHYETLWFPTLPHSTPFCPRLPLSTFPDAVPRASALSVPTLPVCRCLFPVACLDVPLVVCCPYSRWAIPLPRFLAPLPPRTVYKNPRPGRLARQEVHSDVPPSGRAPFLRSVPCPWRSPFRPMFLSRPHRGAAPDGKSEARKIKALGGKVCRSPSNPLRSQGPRTLFPRAVYGREGGPKKS